MSDDHCGIFTRSLRHSLDILEASLRVINVQVQQTAWKWEFRQHASIKNAKMMIPIWFHFCPILIVVPGSSISDMLQRLAQSATRVIMAGTLQDP
jgi:hypothetical protein